MFLLGQKPCAPSSLIFLFMQNVTFYFHGPPPVPSFDVFNYTGRVFGVLHQRQWVFKNLVWAMKHVYWEYTPDFYSAIKS